MTYDIIFAGGGTTACVVAGRLAASRPDLRILLVEQGPHTRELQAHLQPALFPKNMTPDTKVFSFHISQPSNALMGRPIVVPSGRCVGGGSSINFMKYTRASASDYDDWETLYANEGWGSKDMIPLLKKVETYEVEGDQYSHGQSGPIKVSFGGVCLDPGKQFLEVAERYDKFRDVTQDANDFRTVNAYSRWPKYIDRSTGLRSDTAHGFVYNQDQAQNNLTVLADTTVLRVIIKDGRAIGIECDTSTPMSGTTKIFATQLVVISAGAFGSPAILQRSGIGPSQILTALGIPLVVDLPGVGENYLDHQAIVEPYFVSDSTTTLEAIMEMDEEELHSQWQRSGDGLMATNGIDAGVKLRPSVDELRELGPGFQERWKAYFENAPDKPIIWMGPLSNYAGQDTDVPKRRYMSMVTYMGYPASTGRLYITASDLSKPLHFEPGYLNDPSDLEVLRWAYKKGREIARRMPLYRGEPIQCHPAFAPDSDAACGERSGPVDVSAPNIVYTPEDDEAINSHVRMKVQTSWHSMGTCAMKPRADGGVVDSKLNVYGLQGLKLSIAPSNVSANTYNTALGVGEKAAVIIAQELGIKL
ncbi:GMC oxidoreductase family protein [Pleurotus pulmonarius]